MKKWKFITVVFMIGFAASLSSQRGNAHHRDRNGNWDNYKVHQDSRHYNGHTHDVRYYDQRLSRRDRKRVKRLRQELNRCYERAWRDGRISRREARNIRQLEAEIAQYYPRTRDFRRRSYTYSYNRRGTCG
ncbi:MAG: hypothetical protein HKN09_08785 [Saprospiraceae bacterium]|nr:hypothetical protein [Saprospiraceae bacterium]